MDGSHGGEPEHQDEPDQVAEHERGPMGRAVNEIGHKVRVGLMRLYGPARLDDEHDPVEQLEREHGDDTQPEPEEETALEAGMREARQREERFRAEQRKGDEMSEGPTEG